MNVRPFAEADFPAVAAVLADDEQFHGRSIQVGVNELREWTSGADLAKDSWLYEDHDGVVAVGWCATQGEVGFAVGVVHPRAKGRGLGTELVGRSEAALGARDIARIHQFAVGADAAAAALLTAHGYRDIRRFYDMAIHLDEAFQDHWEHHGRGFDEWWNRHRANPNFDPTLWFLVRDGDEIVAVCRNEANRNGGGYVGALGVRRPWRGKGYAKALLLYTFREFYARGMPRVTLGVDAENPTGATHLYERVGMHVEAENVVFEKPVV